MPQIYEKVSEALPTATADGAQVQARGSKYGELAVLPYMQPPYYPHALEGLYFKTTHQTPGTTQAYQVQAAFSATVAFMVIYNSDTVKRIFLDYIKLIPTVAPVSATAGHMSVATDGINRFSSGGTLYTPQNVNANSVIASIATIHVGAVVAAAASATRYIGRGVLFAAIPVVNSEYIIAFNSAAGGAGTIAGTTAQRTVVPCSPVIVGPGSSALLHLWFPGNITTGLSAEFEIAHYER